MHISQVVDLVLIMFVIPCHFAIEIKQEGVKYENICYISLGYIVMYCMWWQLVYHLR